MGVNTVWRQAGGSPVALTGADAAIASFTAPRPTAEEPLHFSLTVTDDSGASASDEITIIVSTNQSPLADAGIDLFPSAAWWACTVKGPRIPRAAP